VREIVSKYQFCSGCVHIIDEKNDEVYTCPSIFNPFDERCPRHDRFIELEIKKRPTLATSKGRKG
jgi:hypothetical protein